MNWFLRRFFSPRERVADCTRIDGNPARWKCGGTRFSLGAFLPINLIASSPSPFHRVFSERAPFGGCLRREIPDAQTARASTSFSPLFFHHKQIHIRACSYSVINIGITFCASHNTIVRAYNPISARNKALLRLLPFVVIIAEISLKEETRMHLNSFSTTLTRFVCI